MANGNQLWCNARLLIPIAGQPKWGGMGMGMANQLELISVYACCSTRAAMMFMEGGDIVPYVGHYLPNWLIIRQNYECWVLNKGRSNRQDRQAGHGRARGLKSVHDCSCFIKFGTISASHYAVSYQLQHRKKFGRLPLISVMNPLYKVQIDDPYGIR